MAEDTGGEPFLNDDYIHFLFDAIIKISKLDSKKFNDSVIIQTNGVFIGQGNTALIKSKLENLLNANSKVKVCIEISIKGTNVEEFELITRARGNRSPSELSKFKQAFGWNLGNYSSSELFDFNINAYYKLRQLASEVPNLQPTIIAGFGINESYLLNEGNCKNRITIISRDNKPIYHPSLWSKDFERLYQDFTREAPRIFGPQFRKMPMYGIKDLFQYAWVLPSIVQASGIYGNRWYDARYASERGGRNTELEKGFADILEKFFLVDNRTYYSALTNWKT